MPIPPSFISHYLKDRRAAYYKSTGHVGGIAMAGWQKPLFNYAQQISYHIKQKQVRV